MRVAVTSETLRGSGTSIPECFAAHVGVQPGAEKQMPTESGLIRVSWGYMSAYLGSLRHVVESLDACEGDLLFVKAVGAGRLACELVRQPALRVSTTEGQLAASVAWGGLGDNVDPRVAICHAIGFEDPETTDALSAATRLRARREPELLPAVEGRGTRSDDEPTLAEILGLLGCDPETVARDD